MSSISASGSYPVSSKHVRGPSAAEHRTPRISNATCTIFADEESRAFEQQLALLAPADATVLIVGETGTGKEIAARELHERSHRAGPFLAVNCGSLNDASAELELFGSEPGMLPNAALAQVGWFEAAAGGTLLLDEVADLTLAVQAKLLRVLQEREVTRIGSRTPRPFDTRIVATTATDLHEAAARGTFRRDLLFRLAVATVRLRPLRERAHDVGPIADHLLGQYANRFGRGAMTFTDRALKALVQYPWPGNVRELDNVVQRSVLLSGGTKIDLEQLGLPAPTPQTAQATLLTPAATPMLEVALAELAERWLAEGEPNMLMRATSAIVQASFETAGGNQVKAAELLGVSRNTLRTQLGRLGIISPRRRRSDEAEWARVRIGTQKFGTSMLLRMGRALERRLAEQNILVEWQNFATGAALMTAIAEDAVDIGNVGEVPPIFAQADGTRMLYVACEQPSPASLALVVRADGDLHEIAQLRGRSLALHRHANVHLLLTRALAAHGLSIKDVEPIYVAHDVSCEPATMDADAWLTWDPHLAALEAQGGIRVLTNGAGLVSNRRFYVASSELVHAQPWVVSAIIAEAQLVAAEALSAPITAAETLAGPFGMRVGDVEQAFRRISATDCAPSDAMADQQCIADHFHDLQLLSRPIRVQDVWWTRESG